jgi:AraC-like DNA-binding protein
MKTTLEIMQAAKAVTPVITTAPSEDKNRILAAMASRLRESAAEILAENAADVEAAQGRITSLLFAFMQAEEMDICHALQEITTAPIRISDDFDGCTRIHNAKHLAENLLHPGAREQLAAELRLLFVCLARKLSRTDNEPAMPQQTLYKERLAILEDYFNIGLKDPNCSKPQLASLLGVTERQLTRILSEVYHSTFSDILLRSRMTIAQAMVMEGRKSLGEIAQAVGYRSEEALKRAYKAYFGTSIKNTK